MRAIYLDVENNNCSVVDIEDKLDIFYEMLNCRTVEMPERRIGVRGKHYFNIICDEEGLLKENPKLSAIDNMGQPMLVGNLLITNVNLETGELAELSISDCEYITNFIQPMCVQNKNTGEIKAYLMLTQCEY